MKVEELASQHIWVIVIAVVLLGLSMLVAVMESALVQISAPKADALAEQHGLRGARLQRITSNPEHYLNPVLLTGLTARLGEVTAVVWLASSLVGGWPVVGISLLNVAVVFVLAEAVPKTWALQNPERAALMSAPGVLILGGIVPLRWISSSLIRVSNVIAPGKGLQQGPWVTEGEILALADAAVEESVLHGDERDLIESIIEFGDTIAREIMVPRTDMVAFENDYRIGDCVEIAILGGLSRFPVFEENVDNIVGVVFTKDLLRAERDDRHGEAVTTLMRDAFFVPETKKVTELLREMQSQKSHMAIVIDEYGGTAGLVTLEDLLEELVGEINDEFDADAPLVHQLNDGSLVVDDPSVNVDDLNDEFDLNLPEGEWDSLGGLVFSELGRVAEIGDIVQANGYELVVEGVDGRRVTKVRITARPIEEPHDD